MSYTDKTPMPFGKFKGKPLEDVPASYLLWLWDNKLPFSDKNLEEYILENLDVLRKETSKK
jgi:uncharacterized protein (DUF3820 family)